MRILTLVAATSLALSACSAPTGSSSADCVNRYSVAAKSNEGARVNLSFCRELHDNQPEPLRRSFLECAIPAAGAAGSDTGVKVALAQCNRQTAATREPAEATRRQPVMTPVVGNPFARDVPSDAFGATDRELARKLGMTLPSPASPGEVRETRERMFLALPENSNISASDASFSAWKEAQGRALDEALAQRRRLDDYQLMEAARDRSVAAR